MKDGKARSLEKKTAALVIKKEDAQLAVLQWISFVFAENEKLLLQAYEKTLTALGNDPAVRAE